MNVSIEIGGRKTRVNQVSRYKVEEDTPDRLVLRAKRFHFLGGGILIVMGSVLLYVAIAVVRDTGAQIGLGAFGALLLAGTAALIRAGLKNEDRVVFERGARAIRFDMTHEKDRHAIAFGDLSRLELRQKLESTASEEKLLFQVYIVKKNGDELMLDEASNPAAMALLAEKAAALCGAPFADRALAKS